MSAWNVLVMLALILFGPLMGGLLSEEGDPAYDRSIPKSYRLPSDPTAEDEALYAVSQAKRTHLTYIFNTFVFLQIFNEINCRKVGRRDFNVFEAVHKNWYFVGVAVSTFAAQVLMCQIPIAAGVAGTVPLSKSEWGGCIAAGATPLVIAVLLKLTPEAWVEKTRAADLFDENRPEENPAIGLYGRLAGTGRGKSGGEAKSSASGPWPSEEDDEGFRRV